MSRRSLVCLQYKYNTKTHSSCLARLQLGKAEKSSEANKSIHFTCWPCVQIAKQEVGASNWLHSRGEFKLYHFEYYTGGFSWCFGVFPPSLGQSSHTDSCTDHIYIHLTSGWKKLLVNLLLSMLLLKSTLCNFLC